jgi:hypothetical protein
MREGSAQYVETQMHQLFVVAGLGILEQIVQDVAGAHERTSDQQDPRISLFAGEVSGDLRNDQLLFGRRSLSVAFRRDVRVRLFERSPQPLLLGRRLEVLGAVSGVRTEDV